MQVVNHALLGWIRPHFARNLRYRAVFFSECRFDDSCGVEAVLRISVQAAKKE